MDSSQSWNPDDETEEEEDKSPDFVPVEPIQFHAGLRTQNPLEIILRSYQRRLETQPVITKAVTAAVVSAIGALIGTVGSTSKRTNRQNTSALQKLSEVCAFALYGGLVGGPLQHYWKDWLDENVNDKYSSSWGILVDQLIAQPPLLFLMHVVLDMAGAAVHELPRAWSRSMQRTGRSVVSSWRFWPAAVYIILYLSKKKRHQTLAMQIAGVYWMAKMARQRAETQPLSSTIR